MCLILLHTFFLPIYLCLNWNSLLRRIKDSLKLKSFLLWAFILGMTVVAQLGRSRKTSWLHSGSFLTPSSFFPQIFSNFRSSCIKHFKHDFFSSFFHEDYLECLSSDNVLSLAFSIFPKYIFPWITFRMKFHVDSSVLSSEMLHPQYKLHWGKINLGDI